MIIKKRSSRDKSLKQLLFEGLTDSFGFAAGAFLCYWLGGLLGFNMAVAGNTSNVGILSVVLILLCGGLGLKLVRRLR